MRYKQLGRTGLLVSELCLGTMTFGGRGHWRAFGALGQAEANALVARALDAGINFFDTADVYAEGEAERLLGKALGEQRKDVAIATKVYGKVGLGRNDLGLSRAHMMRAVDDSLQRLGTDYIDLYQIHAFDPLTPLDETLRALDDLVHAGKVRYIGCSNLAAWQLMKALGLSERHGWMRFETLQGYYSIGGRDLERELVPLLRDQGVGLLVWSPLAGGLLSGKFNPESQGPADARRSIVPFPPVERERLSRILPVMQEIAAAHEVTVAQIALAWLLHQDVVTSVIVGAKNGDQLADNLRAPDVRLLPEELEQLDVASALPQEYPGWMIAVQTAHRMGLPIPGMDALNTHRDKT